MTQQVTYTYVLKANKKGNFTINPATVTVNGKPIKSNTVTVNVVEPSQVEKQRRKQEKDSQKSLSRQAEEIIKNNIFIRTFVSKKKVYLGEQLVATYKLFVHPELNIKELNAKKSPAFNGFWTQEINLGDNAWRNENYNGVRYRVATIKKVILLPQQSGKLAIEPFSFDCVARLKIQGQRRRRRNTFDSFFDDPFFGGNYKDFPYVVSSKKQFVNVIPLPADQPEDFNGGVGKMSLEAWIDKPAAKTGEPISLKVKISGSGNLKLLEPLALNFPPDFEAYDPKIADNVNVSANGISGNKIFEYLLIPRHVGEYKIGPVHFSYFDLGKKQYVSLTSKEFNVQVAQGDGNETSVVSGVQKEDVKYLGKDIRFLKTNTNLKKADQNKVFGSLGFSFLSMAPLFLFLIILFYRRKKQKLAGNQALLKNRKATKVARKHLNTAKKLLLKKEQDAFFEEISKALWGYLSDKLSIPVSDLTKDRATEVLESYHISEELISRCMSTIDNSEFARFAPSSTENKMDSVFSDAVSIITDLEGALK